MDSRLPSKLGRVIHLSTLLENLVVEVVNCLAFITTLSVGEPGRGEAELAEVGQDHSVSRSLQDPANLKALEDRMRNLLCFFLQIPFFYFAF